MKLNENVDDSNILISYQNNKKELITLKKKYELLINEMNIMKKENTKLKSQNENLNSLVTMYKSKEMNLNDMNNKLSKKDYEYKTLNEDFLEQKKQYCEELRMKDVKYEKELGELNLKQESMKYQMKNFEKMSELNNIFYYKILELEKMIEDNKTDEQKKLQEIKMSYILKLENYKKKTITFLKKEKEQAKKLGTQESLNAKLNILHIQELTDELEIQSREILNLVSEKNKLKLQILCLSNDLEIYHDILKAKTDRNNNVERKLIEYINEKNQSSVQTVRSEKDSLIDFCNNKLKDISENENHKKPIINKNILKNLKKLEVNLSTKKKVNNSNNTITNSSGKLNTCRIMKEYKDVIKEKEKYKDLYSFYKEKYELLTNRYSDILNAYNEELEKLYDENKNIFAEENIDLSNFKNFQFQNMKPEQKYWILTQLINNIAPLVIKKDLDTNNIFKKSFQTKDKYNFDMTRSMTFSNVKNSSSLHSSIKRNDNSNYYNVTDNKKEIGKLNKTLFHKKNCSVIKIDSKKRLYIKMQNNNSGNNF